MKFCALIQKVNFVVKFTHEIHKESLLDRHGHQTQAHLRRFTNVSMCKKVISHTFFS